MVSTPIERSEVRPVPVYVAPSPDLEDEVNLSGLLRIILRRKAVILYTFFAFLLSAGIYLLVAKPLYQATVHLMPPQLQDVQGLLLGGAAVEGLDTSIYTQESVYKAFLANLRSQGIRREFFDSHKLISYYLPDSAAKEANADRIFNEHFDKQLQMQADRMDPFFVTVSLAGTKPELTARLLNQVIAYAENRTIEQFFTGLSVAIQNQVGNLEQQVAVKLELAEKRKLDRILELKESLRIAEALDLNDTSMFPIVVDKTLAGLSVNTAQVPLYMRGKSALKAEIGVLEARNSNEPFVSGLRDLQERIAFLKVISIDRDSLSAVTIDEMARVPYQSVSPNYLMVAMLAGAVGIVAGVFAAFFFERLAPIESGQRSLSDVG